MQKTYQLENDVLSVGVFAHGAELSSLVKKATGTEYLWQGDSAYWGRRSPVLFPLVGSVQDKQYRVDGVTYAMGQHGFARDMDFVLEEQTEQSITFSLRSDAETLTKYPYDFKLTITYVLEGRDVQVRWTVENPGSRPLDFSIGGHPAFYCPLDGNGQQTDYYLNFHSDKKLRYGQLNGQGVLARKDLELDTRGGLMPIPADLFDNDALIIEDRQLTQVSLAGPDGRDYLTVTCDSPLMGIWSPAKKHAPFICIEPWYGRCDNAGYDGEWKDREYGNTLLPGEVFEAAYTITVE